MSTVKCSKDCGQCKSLNIKTDDKGYPWGYECTKHGDSVFQENFRNTKTFSDQNKHPSHGRK